MKKNNVKKIAHSFQSDLKKDLRDPRFRKAFYSELLKLQIAEEVIKLRQERGLSQAGLAKKIKTTQAVLSRIENAQVYPSTYILQRICDTLEVGAKFEFCKV